MAITDLKGTTWEVASGWQASAGYGKFVVDCTVNDKQIQDTLNIGYELAPDGVKYVPTPNYIDYWTKDGSRASFYTNETLTIAITDGADTTNPDLIQWLETYGTNITPQPEPEEPTEYIEVTYADKVFKLTAGQKITFRGGKVMQSDIVAKVVEGEEMATVDITITSDDSSLSGIVYDYATGEFGDILAYLPVGTTSMTVPIGTKIHISHDGAHTYFNYSSHSGDIEKLYDHRFIINGNGSITGYFTTAGSGGSND